MEEAGGLLKQSKLLACGCVCKTSASGPARRGSGMWDAGSLDERRRRTRSEELFSPSLAGSVNRCIFLSSSSPPFTRSVVPSSSRSLFLLPIASVATDR